MQVPVDARRDRFFYSELVWTIFRGITLRNFILFHGKEADDLEWSAESFAALSLVLQLFSIRFIKLQLLTLILNSMQIYTV